MRVLLDTNILLRVANVGDPLHAASSAAYLLLIENNHVACYSPQNATEFWSVATRPVHQNGFGLAVPEVDEQISLIEQTLRLLTVTEETYHRWRQLVVRYEVTGKQVHDTMLAALMYAHSITHLLTWNAKDFKRFDRITALTPDEVLAGAL